MKRAFLKFCILLTFYSINLKCHSLSLKDYNLLPIPQQIEFSDSLILIDSVSLHIPVLDKEWRKELDKIGFKVSEKAPYEIKGKIKPVKSPKDSIRPEYYHLSILNDSTLIEAETEKGLYWALVTFSQLCNKNSDGKIFLPICEISDWPAFPVRGFMIDCGRSYISMEELKRLILTMSKFKLNVFHWHLTDNQAWRLQSEKYPQLNHSGNMTRQPGLFYTKEEAKELAEFCRTHNVLLIPEIDMPGHSAAFTRTFGFDMQSPQGIEIVKGLLEEVCEIFPDLPYIHIGTDEVKFTNKEFAPEISRFLKDKDKKIMVWNPGWEYQNGEVDLIQMWSYRGKPLNGIASVDSRFHYINHFDTYADIRALYRSKIYGESHCNDTIKGTILGLWNDRYVENEKDLFKQNNTYPSLLAIAERSWTGGGSEYFDKLGVNMGDPGSEDLEAFSDFERRLIYHKGNTLKDIEIPYFRQCNIKWRITDPFPNNGDLSLSFPPESEGIKMVYEYNDSLYYSKNAMGAGIYLRHVWGNTIPAFYENPLPHHTAYAMTRVFSPMSQTVGLNFETQNYSRSEADIPPPQGSWDYRQSKIWINGKEIQPPLWLSQHITRDNEISLQNENMTVRPPLPVELQEGWNDILIKLPVGEFKTPETRLVKWMFSCLFTSLDGLEEIPDLEWSPD